MRICSPPTAPAAARRGSKWMAPRATIAGAARRSSATFRSIAVQEMTVLDQRVFRRIRRQHRQRHQHHHQVRRQPVSRRSDGTVAASGDRSGALRISPPPTRPAETISPATRWDKRRCRSPARSASKTHFFAAGEFSREDRASPIISPVAPASFRGPLSRLARDSSAWTIRSTTRTICSSAAMSTAFTTPIPTASWAATACPRVDRVFHRRTYSKELGETAVLSPTLLNNVRLQFQLASPITEFDPGDLRHAVRGARSRPAARSPPARRNRRC